MQNKSDNSPFANKLKIGLFLLSALGLIFSFSIHIALFFDINVQDFRVSPFILHIGVFLVFIPSLLLYLLENRDSKDKDGRQNSIKKLYTESPKIIGVIVFLTYIYGIINFFTFMGTMPGGPAIQEGKYVLSNHGTVYKELTFEEYQFYRRLEVRGFSGHWMIFFSVALLLSNPFRKKEKILRIKEREIINQLELPFIRFEKRLFESGKFLFILSGISIPLFVFFLFYFPHFFLLAVTVIFPINLVLNLYFFISWSKYYIKSYSIKDNHFQVEVYRYNTRLYFDFTIPEVSVQLNKKRGKGGETSYLSFFNSDKKEIFSQFESKLWSPNSLMDLERALKVVNS